MRRLFVATITAISGLMALCFICLWCYSYFRQGMIVVTHSARGSYAIDGSFPTDRTEWHYCSQTEWEAEWARGYLEIGVIRSIEGDAAYAHYSAKTGRQITWSEREREIIESPKVRFNVNPYYVLPPERNWSLLGFAAFGSEFPRPQALTDSSTFGTAGDKAFYFPAWSAVAVTTILPALQLVRRVRTLRRRSGFCVECGYNLTGNVSGKCPECGEYCRS